MKKEIATYVNKCQTRQQVKVKHKKLAEKLQSFLILEWKWDYVRTDFMVGLPKS